MSESKLVSKLVKVLREELGSGYSVEEKVNLIYWAMIDKNLEYRPRDPKNPRRGKYAFQVDIAVGEKRSGGFLPLVVIEVKYNKNKSFNTHAVLAYSEKALKHKAIYPYVRYGLVLYGGEDHIPLRFFIHNVGLDFAIAVKDIDNREERQSLVNAVKEQIEVARNLLDVFEGRKVKAFVARTLIQWSEYRS